MILPHRLLNPTSYQVQDPFASLMDCMETWIKEKEPGYLDVSNKNNWQKVKYGFARRILGLGKNGSALRGQAQLAPNTYLNSALFDIYHLLDHSIYFTSQYWRAFYYWMKTGKLNPCWPQFSEREALVTYSLLTPEDIELIKIEAGKEWADVLDPKLIDRIFKKIKRPVYRLCYKRAGFLQNFDPALYSLADLQQYVLKSVLVSLRNSDHISRSFDWLVGWSVKCADNALHNVVTKATAKKRNRAIDEDECTNSPCFSSDTYRHRECYLSLTPFAQDKEEEEKDPFTLLDSLRLLGNQPFKEAEDMENNACLKELLKLADPKINSYLRTICGGEHNPEFWTWFYYNEPTLAQRIAYIEENPEALGPFLQRHLNLPTHQLTSFLKQHLPTLLERVSNSSTSGNRARAHIA